MNVNHILKRPLLSEKTNLLKDSEGKYVFWVDLKATKNDVKLAVEQLFDVSVLSVNTAIVRGKYKRRGQFRALESSKKKAIVQLKNSQRIALFEQT